MRKLALALCAVALALLVPGRAAAHPLGNFTVNHYAGIELAGDTIYVHYALDLAEIPTFQDGDKVQSPAFARRVAREAELRVDGRKAPLELVSSKTSTRPGAGGLNTLRFDAVLRSTARGTTLTYFDPLYPGRIGWHEITARSRDGAVIRNADVPSTSLSDELRSYPKDSLSSPLDVRRAEVRFTLGTRSATPPSLADATPAAHRGGGFESLIGRGKVSPGIILLSLLIAAFWGSVHALTPGHGKALVAGYLVGTRGRPRDAVILGATVTVTHTIGVFALGLVTLALSQFIVPEQLYPWLTLVSGLLVVGVGFAVLRSRLRTGGWADHEHHDGDDHPHEHGHSHDHSDHEHGHEHHHHHHGDDNHDERLTARGILGVGIAAGLLPCPSALVVLLSAIALHRIGFGFALIVAFSVGLAATITSIGLVAVVARRTFARASFEGRVVRALPAVSAAVILLVGVGLTVKAVPGVLTLVGA